MDSAAFCKACFAAIEYPVEAPQNKSRPKTAPPTTKTTGRSKLTIAIPSRGQPEILSHKERSPASRRRASIVRSPSRPSLARLTSKKELRPDSSNGFECRTSHKQQEITQRIIAAHMSVTSPVARCVDMPPDEALQGVASLVAKAWHTENCQTDDALALLRAQQRNPERFAAVQQLAVHDPPSATDDQDIRKHMHPAGTAVYYGTKLALQAHHGGYLALDETGTATAMTQAPTPNAAYTVWNLSNLNDTGLMRYGDRIWLQCGRYEVLGTSAVQQNYSLAWSQLLDRCAGYDRWDEATNKDEDNEFIVSSTAKRTIVNKKKKEPSGPDWLAYAKAAKAERDVAASRQREKRGRLLAVCCAGAEAFPKARLAGRWVIVNRRSPRETLGQVVTHLDEIALQQENLYVSSRHAERAELVVIKSQHFEEPGDKTRKNKARALTEMQDKGIPNTSVDECLDREYMWILHVLDQAPNSGDEQKRLHRAMRARSQLERSAASAKRAQYNLVKIRCEQHLSLRKAIADGRDIYSYNKNRPAFDQLAIPKCPSDRRSPKLSLVSSPLGMDGNEVSSPPPPNVFPSRMLDTLSPSKLELAKSAYENCLRDQNCALMAYAAIDRVSAHRLVRENRAVHTLQSFFRDRLYARWPWKLAKADRHCDSEHQKARADTLLKSPEKSGFTTKNVRPQTANQALKKSLRKKAGRPATARQSRISKLSIIKDGHVKNNSHIKKTESCSADLLDRFSFFADNSNEVPLTIDESERFVGMCRPKSAFGAEARRRAQSARPAPRNNSV